MKNIVIGITGGIGSGKSTVSSIFSELDYPVINSDVIARDIMNNDPAVMNRIISDFGDNCYSNNKLNSKVLADKVFSNKENINRINNIVHPPTLKKIEEELNSYKRKSPIIFVESALIYEAKMEYLVDYVLLVTAEEEIRIERVITRNKETADEIKDRMSNQISEDQKKGKSDFIIENNSTLEELREKALFFLNLFQSIVV